MTKKIRYRITVHFIKYQKQIKFLKIEQGVQFHFLISVEQYYLEFVSITLMFTPTTLPPIKKIINTGFLV